MLKSYNEEFYTNLKSLKFIKNPLPPDEKFFYHFEQNENASVSTTTGQLLSTYDELVSTNEAIKRSIKTLKDEIQELHIQLDEFDQNVTDEFKPEIQKLSEALLNHINSQKTENIRLKKEISILEKEKLDLQQDIYNALGYLHKLEREVGIKAKTYTYIYDQNISENELSSKFVVEKEDI